MLVAGEEEDVRVGMGLDLSARNSKRPAWLPRVSSDLPPGQGAVEGFPRFGWLWQPAGALPEAKPTMRVCGLVDEAFDVPVSSLRSMKRRQLTADFHCVAGWSARDVRWEGVPFRLFYEEVIVPRIPAGTTVSHLLLEAEDGWRADAFLEDALAADVLLADRLDGGPLTNEHGAPVRFVSPAQYGYKNVKHLVKIEVCDCDPNDLPERLLPRVGLFSVRAHPRARVALEERHRYLPARALRWPYRYIVYPLIAGVLSVQEILSRASGNHE